MKNSFVLSAAILAGTATFALADQQSGAVAAQQNATARPAGAQISGSGQQNQQLQQQEEQDYIRHASSDNQLEIQMGQLVQQKAENQQVKQLAQRLVQDHQKAQQQLQQVAQAMKIEISDQLDPVGQAKLQAFQRKQGQEMERGFTFDQVGDHTKDILVNQFVAENAQDSQIKQYAQQQIPILEEHLRLARAAAEQYVPEARTAGERIRGAAGDVERRTRDLTGAGSSGSSSGTGSSGNSGSNTGGTSGSNR